MTLAQRAAIANAILNAESDREATATARHFRRLHRAATQPTIEGVAVQGMWFEDRALAEAITGEKQ